MPVILVTQEAEIRRIEVRSLCGQILPQTPSQKYQIPKKGWQSGASDRVPA
jgi:hypothetical protein